ncbi:hypothetical protein [Roseateles sp. L2-2]|uniref:hypothetical protein n=1 Tax=Roseateles TaxID=93681 RepID=UPI003D369981
MFLMHSRRADLGEFESENMQVLTEQEIDMVSGGDSWAGTPEGRAPVPTPSQSYVDCVNERSDWPGVSESSAMISCGMQKIWDLINEI